MDTLTVCCPYRSSSNWSVGWKHTRSELDGSLITILNNDKHGALTVKFRGTRFALGRRIADHIEIEEVHTHE